MSKEELIKALAYDIMFPERMERVIKHAAAKEIEERNAAMKGDLVISMKRSRFGYWASHGCLYVSNNGEVYVPEEVKKACQKFLRTKRLRISF